MPYILRIGSQVVILDDADADRVLTQLVRMVRLQVWGRAGGPDSYFQSYYRIWQSHSRYHDINLFLWTVEALGGATLPSSANVNRLRNLNRALNSCLTPRRIGEFFRRFPEYDRRQGRFVRDMRRYLDRVVGGTGTLITIAEVTRDASFFTLSVCAGILTAGASTAAEAAAVTTGSALMRSAASTFLISQIEHCATNIGRTMAGERVTYSETGSEIMNDAIGALTDAMLGEVVGHFLEPLVGDVTTFARREISRGNLTGGMSMEITNTMLEDAVTGAIQQMLREGPGTVRRLLEACRGSSGPRAYARLFAEGFMQDRLFRRLLEAQIQRAGGG
ncbi:MAG: hypothetical protein KF887_09835 [Paracoccaceae bacterium]|nr:MAG: hypothetical protein KF887_09835 [Paracoccaceae bacterium]